MLPLRDARDAALSLSLILLLIPSLFSLQTAVATYSNLLPGLIRCLLNSSSISSKFIFPPEKRIPPPRWWRRLRAHATGRRTPSVGGYFPWPWEHPRRSKKRVGGKRCLQIVHGCRNIKIPYLRRAVCWRVRDSKAGERTEGRKGRSDSAPGLGSTGVPSAFFSCLAAKEGS